MAGHPLSPAPLTYLFQMEGTVGHLHNTQSELRMQVTQGSFYTTMALLIRMTDPDPLSSGDNGVQGSKARGSSGLLPKTSHVRRYGGSDLTFPKANPVVLPW